MSSGSQIVGRLIIGDNVTIASHSLVIHDCKSNTLQVGVPAVEKRINYDAWYLRDGQEYTERVELVRQLKTLYGL